VHINDLKKDCELIDIFCSLAEIPSPSLKEDNVRAWIIEFCKKNNITYNVDLYGNIILKINATEQSKQPIALSAHMDVVGDISEVLPILENDYIHAKNRTLGADDKAGVAAALLLAKRIINSNLKHGGLEIVFTRDEESGMSGIHHFDFNSLESKYVLVLDADKLGQLLISGASYTNALFEVNTVYGGHSGIDIADEKRVNAVKLIAELVSDLPQGVFYKDETGVITSCNAGSIVGGGIQNAVKALIDEQLNSSDYIDEITRNSANNIINTEAKAYYSIRSASIEKETELKELMISIVDNFNKKYINLANAKVTFTKHLPPFERPTDDFIQTLHTKVCDSLGIKNAVESFHAGAETHIYAQNKNAKGETFVPFLVGLADIYNMHSSQEKINYISYLKGYEILEKLFYEFNN